MLKSYISTAHTENCIRWWGWAARMKFIREIYPPLLYVRFLTFSQKLHNILWIPTLPNLTASAQFFCTNTWRVKLKSHIFFHLFPDKKSKNTDDPKDSCGPHVGGSGCREYVYLQIKLSVLKQYLPGLFRYTSAVKPWVQPSLYCVNLPSFSPDSISFLPPPNTPIHIPIRSAQLTRKMLLLMVAK